MKYPVEVDGHHAFQTRKLVVLGIFSKNAILIYIGPARKQGQSLVQFTDWKNLDEIELLSFEKASRICWKIETLNNFVKLKSFFPILARLKQIPYK